MEIRVLSLWMERRTCRVLIVLTAAIGVVCLVAGCATGLPVSTPIAVQPSPSATQPPVLTHTPSPQPAATPSPTLLPPTIPILSPALPSDARLLASIPVSVYDPYGNPIKELYSLDWSPDGRSLAYGWQDEIWIVREPAYERSLVVSIFNGREIDDISWSPGGQYLAFHGDQPWKEFWGEFIWVVKADGTGLKNLTTDPPFDPLRALAINEWLDDQTLTINVWEGTGAQSLCQVDLVSGKATLLIGYGDSKIPIQAHGGSYDWSPTHEHIVINQGSSGHLVLVNVSQASELWFSTMEEPPSEVFRGWSQDGQRFLYSKWDKERGEYNLWLWDVAQGEGEKLLPHVYQAALSPDGSQVAFLRQEERPGWVPARVKPEVSPEDWPPALTAGVLNLETGETILYGPAGYKANEGPRYWQGGQPVWSPDGELVVYWGEEGDIWAASADGQWRQRLTQGMEIIQVLWSPDGGKLALRSLDHAWIIERPVVEE